jgi:hypothetical protein
VIIFLEAGDHHIHTELDVRKRFELLPSRNLKFGVKKSEFSELNKQFKCFSELNKQWNTKAVIESVGFFILIIHIRLYKRQTEW